MLGPLGICQKFPQSAMRRVNAEAVVHAKESESPVARSTGDAVMDPDASVVRLTVWSAMALSSSRAASSKQVASRTCTHFRVSTIVQVGAV